jgi:hypothetical protein
MPPSRSPTQCTVYLHGYTARVSFSSQTLDVVPACANWVNDSARQGQRWLRVAKGKPAPSPPDLAPVCVLASVDENVTALVEDDGRQMHGQAACAGLLARGWVAQQQVASTTTTGTTAQSITDPGGNRCARNRFNSLGYCVPTAVTGTTYTDPLRQTCVPVDTNGSYCRKAPY